MRIISVEAVPVNLPFVLTNQKDSLGTYSSSNHGIVIIRDEAGNYGAGEIALAWFGGAHSLCTEINRYWAELLIGENPAHLSKISRKLDRAVLFSKRHLLAKAGIEMALLDLLGKSWSVPVHALLGGKIRDRVPVSATVSIDEIDRMVDKAGKLAADGFTHIKIKVGSDDDKDLESVRRIRAILPDDISLRLDANMAWRDVKRAKRLLDEMEAIGVAVVEQPFPVEYIRHTAWLRANTGMEVMLDESSWELHDVREAFALDAADLLNVYVSEAGGPLAAKRIFELAELHGIECIIGSMPEGIVGLSASLQLGGAMPNLSRYGSDLMGFTLYMEDVGRGGFQISEGWIDVPDTPGLGVDIDFERLEKLKRDINLK